MRKVERIFESLFEKICICRNAFIPEEMIDCWLSVVIDHKKRGSTDVRDGFLLGYIARGEFVERHVGCALLFGFDLVARTVTIPAEQPIGWFAEKTGCFQRIKAGLVYVGKDKTFVTAITDVFNARVVDERDVTMREQGHLDTGRGSFGHGQKR